MSQSDSNDKGTSLLINFQRTEWD